MVIDVVKGVEDCICKLMEVICLCDMLIFIFMNKFDCDICDLMELFDEVENELKIGCVLIIWLIGCGKLFKGVYYFYKDEIYFYQSGKGYIIQEVCIVKGLNNLDFDVVVGEDLVQQLCDELELVKGVFNEFDKELFFVGEIILVFFGIVLGNFGVDYMLDGLVEWVFVLMLCQIDICIVEVSEDKFIGFVFKIQVNMDLKYCDCVVFMCVVFGKYEKGMKLCQVCIVKDVVIFDVLIFMVGDCLYVEEVYLGDIFGLYNYGIIQIGDIFIQGEMMKFIGILNFVLELFCCICLKDLLK